MIYMWELIMPPIGGFFVENFFEKNFQNNSMKMKNEKCRINMPADKSRKEDERAGTRT